MEALEQDAIKAAGEKFCLGSPNDVSRVLFQSLKLAAPARAKSLRNGDVSTKSEASSQRLQHRHLVYLGLLRSWVICAQPAQGRGFSWILSIVAASVQVKIHTACRRQPPQSSA